MQLEDEVQIQDRIDYAAGAVTNVTVQCDVMKFKDTTKDVRQTKELLRELQEFALTLNSRQKLFGVPVVPFEKLNQLIKDFEPYQNFWLTVEGQNDYFFFFFHNYDGIFS